MLTNYIISTSDILYIILKLEECMSNKYLFYSLWNIRWHYERFEKNLTIRNIGWIASYLFDGCSLYDIINQIIILIIWFSHTMFLTICNDPH